MNPEKIVTALALAAAVASCSRHAAPRPPAPAPLPRALDTIESAAEDAYDQALASRFSEVSDSAAVLAREWSGFRRQAVADGASPTDVDELDSSIARLQKIATTGRSRVEVARAANAVSAPMPDLFALYRTEVPAPVLALDYLGREVALDALESDFTAATRDLDSLEQTFDPLRPELLDAGGAQVAESYRAALAEQRRAVASADAKGLRASANRGLELVDSMERVFASRGARSRPAR